MSKFLAFFVGGWQGVLAAMAIAGLIAGGASVYLTSLGYRIAIANMQRDQSGAALAQANLALKQFTADAGAIHDAAASFSGISANLGDQLATITKGFNSAIKAHPLPADCKPDADRLRALTNATAATNSAAGLRLGTTVPRRP